MVMGCGLWVVGVIHRQYSLNNAMSECRPRPRPLPLNTQSFIKIVNNVMNAL